MKLFVPPEIEQYAHDHTRARPPLLDELRDYTYAHTRVPEMQVGRVEGTLLKLLAAMIGARRILEIGTFTGYSALSMAEALPDDGELVTCDRSEEYAAIARSFFDKSPHGRKIRIVLGDGLESARAADGPFCLAFVDADKARYPEYYETIVAKLRPGGLYVADNVLWSGRVLAPDSEDSRGIVAFNERVTADPRVENVLLPIRDGVMIARKR